MGGGGDADKADRADEADKDDDDRDIAGRGGGADLVYGKWGCGGGRVAGLTRMLGWGRAGVGAGRGI